MLVNASATCWITLPNTCSSLLSKAWSRSRRLTDGTRDFLLALKPVNALHRIIASLGAPQFVALHARVESDLSKSRGHFRSSTTPQVLWQVLRGSSVDELATHNLFVAVSRSLAPNVQEFKESPWPNSKLRFGGAELAASRSLPHVKKWADLYGAVIDLHICYGASSFVGARISTFSWLIAMVRSLNGMPTNVYSYFGNESLTVHRCNQGSCQPPFRFSARVARQGPRAVGF